MYTMSPCSYVTACVDPLLYHLLVNKNDFLKKELLHSKQSLRASRMHSAGGKSDYLLFRISETAAKLTRIDKSA